MKRYCFLEAAVAAVAAALLLTGCGESAYTKEQTTQMAEYMAKKILDYDKHYEEKLLPAPEATKAPEESAAPEQTPAASKELEAKDLTAKGGAGGATKPADSQGDLGEMLGANELKVRFQSFEICQSYPKNGLDSYFIVDAGALHKLVVLKFNIKNPSGKQVKIDTASHDISYSLLVDDAAQKPSMTLLVNDLQYLEENLAPGQAMDAVLIFEVPSDAKCKKMSLTAAAGGSSMELQVK